MRPFDEPNLTNGWTCPVCGRNDKKPVVLVGIAGTEEGNKQQAIQIHLDCIELQLYSRGKDKIIAQFIEEEEWQEE